MATLSRDLRRELERAVIQARRVAEEGARKALDQLAVHHHEPWGSLKPDQRALRNRLRAHGRQLGDRRDEKRGTQAIDHLVRECAYEHWHRMLFARFLAECDLLIEPESGMPLSLDECRQLAREQSADWLALASDFAVGMLPQIFRQGDPVLEVALPPETRQELEELLKGLSAEVFAADDSLGWVYQFWQAERKDEVNASGEKIGADELPAVTQLFTEDYMVLFLLHNTLGAWWAGKVLTANPELASSAKDEDGLRATCSLQGYEWTYLRFVRQGEDGPWRPAAGTFDGWPRAARDLKVLDPCMGSGHFLVFALPILVAFRMEEEGLSREHAVEAALRDNLFGLEIDPRCTQIAAFNLALAAWRMVGYRPLPALNLACSGVGINAKEEDWLKLGGKDERLRGAMQKLYHLFQQAPVLGSLIDPKRVGGTLFAAEFKRVRPLLEQALSAEETDESMGELAVAAQGIVKAARILADTFTLIPTNVPYLGREGHAQALMDFADLYAPDASADLSTLMLHRCLEFLGPRCTVSIVLPQNWWVGKSYTEFRKRLLGETTWRLAAVLGEEAWWTFANRGPNTALVIIERESAGKQQVFPALDLVTKPGAVVVGLQTKAAALAGRQDNAVTAKLSKFIEVNQLALREGRQSRISVASAVGTRLLADVVVAGEGCSTGDNDRFLRCFWETGVSDDWLQYCTPGFAVDIHCDCSQVMYWESGHGELAVSPQARIQNTSLWERRGVLIGRVRGITATLFVGGCFSKGGVLVSPREPGDLLPIYAFLRSRDYENLVRTIDPRVSAATSVVTDIPFDLVDWKRVADEQYTAGLPKPQSGSSTQALFDGSPNNSAQPLQVAVARLLGYRWPRQTGSSFPDCPALGPDGLEHHADADGIVCLSSIKGEPAAADRLRALLADAFGSEWSATKQAELLSQVGYAGKSLEEWLRDGFFEQHFELFHQRPFIWHIWDGLKNGFHAVVNYHKLAGPKGEARRALEKLIYFYLGDWTDRQRADQKAGVEGADLRVAAAQHLKTELEKILEGEPPYDIFIRWKPLVEQPIGWEPDINDGVRINIRPFIMAKPLNGRGKSASILRYTPKIRWDKDRGKEPHRPKEDFPWFWSWDESDKPDFAGGKEFDGNRWNDLHYTRKSKQPARERHAARQKEHGK
jgi:hypothetical protein